MAKRGRPKAAPKTAAPRTAKRGPYLRDIKDPDQLGTGGIRLRQHRLSRGWTVEMLAGEAGVSHGTISGIENGELGYSHLTLLKLARALRITIGQLFDVDPRAGTGETFWPLWHQANDHERQRITDLARGVVRPKK